MPLVAIDLHVKAIGGRQQVQCQDLTILVAADGHDIRAILCRPHLLDAWTVRGQHQLDSMDSIKDQPAVFIGARGVTGVDAGAERGDGLQPFDEFRHSLGVTERGETGERRPFAHGEIHDGLRVRRRGCQRLVYEGGDARLDEWSSILEVKPAMPENNHRRIHHTEHLLRVRDDLGDARFLRYLLRALLLQAKESNDLRPFHALLGRSLRQVCQLRETLGVGIV